MKLVATRKTLIITAAVVSSRRVPRMRRSGRPGARRLAVDLRHDRHAGLEAGEAERELGEHEQREPDGDERVAAVAACSAFVQCSTACGWRSSCTTPSITTTALSTR